MIEQEVPTADQATIRRGRNANVAHQLTLILAAVAAAVAYGYLNVFNLPFPSSLQTWFVSILFAGFTYFILYVFTLPLLYLLFPHLKVQAVASSSAHELWIKSVTPTEINPDTLTPKLHSLVLNLKRATLAILPLSLLVAGFSSRVTNAVSTYVLLVLTFALLVAIWLLLGAQVYRVLTGKTIFFGGSTISRREPLTTGRRVLLPFNPLYYFGSLLYLLMFSALTVIIYALATTEGLF